MSNPVEFIQNNKEWLVPIIIAILTALITEICNLFRKSGKSHKQKVGKISKSHHITLINGEVNHHIEKNKAVIYHPTLSRVGITYVYN